jgi:hypothetical protein
MATSYTRSINIGKERHDFLATNPDVNFAALARAALDREMMKRGAKVE